MLKLIRLYSEDNKFQEINFHSGINLIVGDRSVDEEGVVQSQKQNGVGKSLTIDLINYCFLIKSSETRVSKINDKYLPKDSFVSLHFNIHGKDCVIGRNRAGKIRIKEGNDGFEEYRYEDARSKLNELLGFNRGELSAREYLNYMIKGEDYSFRKFAVYYSADYCDLLKVHFYFFGLSIETLMNIKKSFSRFNEARTISSEAKKRIEEQGHTVEKLQALQNELSAQVEKIESGLQYDDVVENIQKSARDINQEEVELNELLREKKALELQLSEIVSFAQIFNDDFYIDDKDIEVLFSKYKTGLGELIAADVNELRSFRDQVMKFKNELLTSKRTALESAIEELSGQIRHKQAIITRYHKEVLNSKSNNLVKGFRVYKEQLGRFDENSRLLSSYNDGEASKNLSKGFFADFIAKLDDEVSSLEAQKDVFQKTYIKIHEAIMGSSNATFNFTVQRDFMKEKFFKFHVFAQGIGSKGIDQLIAIIYDLALMVDDYTRPRNLMCAIHDNLVFGSLDKDTSINVLNYLNGMSENSFQYIATVNTDDFGYAELEDQFDFDVSTKIVKRLTKEDPMFGEQHVDFYG